MKWILKWLSVILLFLVWVSPGWAGEGKAYIYMDSPADNIGTVGRAGLAADIEGLRGYQIRLKFDPEAIQVMDADPVTKGIQVQPGSMFRDVPAAANMVDNTRGEIVFSTADPGYEITGAAELIWFNYKKVGAGNPSLAIADGGVLIVDTKMKETRLKTETAPGEPPQLKATKSRAPELPSEKMQEQKTGPPSEKRTDTAVETGARPGLPKEKADSVGRNLSYIGGILLTVLIADYLYRRKSRKGWR